MVGFNEYGFDTGDVFAEDAVGCAEVAYRIAGVENGGVVFTTGFVAYGGKGDVLYELAAKEH